MPGPRAAHVARPRPAAHRRGGPRQDDRHRPGHRGRVRRARPAQRRGPRDGLEPVLRPGGPVAPDHPEAPRAAVRAERRLAAVQPRDRRPVSDGLDVQADHRVRRAQPGHHHAEHADQRPGLHRDRRREAVVLQRGQGGQRDAQPAARDPGLLGRLLLHAGPRPQPARRPAAAEDGPPPRPRRDDGHRPPGRGAGPRARPPLARRGRRARAPLPQAPPHPADRARRLRHLRHAPVDGRRQREPRGRPGRPAGLAAADGRRLRGDRERRPRRAAAPRRRGRGPERPRAPEDRSGRRRGGSGWIRARALRSCRACTTRDHRETARRPTSSRAGTRSRSRSTARRARPSAPAMATSPGTCASCPTRAARSCWP